jgi:hypothetical protein
MRRGAHPGIGRRRSAFPSAAEKVIYRNNRKNHRVYGCCNEVAVRGEGEHRRLRRNPGFCEGENIKGNVNARFALKSRSSTQ